MNNSINISRLLGKEKKQTELYIGSVPYNWEYLVAGFTADCTEGLPLSIFDKTICGILYLDGKVHLDTLGQILGLNIKDDPSEGEYRDRAEYSLLFKAVQSLLDFNMVTRDLYDCLQLTDIGREYYSKGKKFRTTIAKSFKVYLDTTGAGHAKAKAIFDGVMAKGTPWVVPEPFVDERFLKTFIHEQLPDIHDPEKGNSFTNLACPNLGQKYSVPVQIAALYDVLTKETRFVAILEEKVNKDLTEVVSANAALCRELRLSFRAQLHPYLLLPRDAAQQERFEAGVLDAPATADSVKDIAALVPPVLEPGEFWQALPLLIGEKEKQVYFRQYSFGAIEREAIVAFAQARPDTSVFVSYSTADEPLPNKGNLFPMQNLLGDDFLCCTEAVTYAARGYSLTLDGVPASARMVFRYPDAETDTDTLRVQFAQRLLPAIYSETMAFLDTDFDPTWRSVRNVAKCDARVNVFNDFLKEDLYENLRVKKQETFNRVKLAYEKVLVDKVSALSAQFDPEKVDTLKGIEDMRSRLDAIIKDTDDTYILLKEAVRPFRDILRDREMYIREEKMAKYFIFDTNVFLDDPDILSKISRRDRVVLAAGVVSELDKMKLKSADPEKAANARKAVHTIKEEIQKGKRARKKFILLEAADMSLLHPEFQEAKGDNYILGVAVKFRDRNPFLLTSDTLFSIAAEVEGIPTVSLREFYAKYGDAPADKPEVAAAGMAGRKSYMDVYKEIYAKKGFVLLNKFEKECGKAGITPYTLGYETFAGFVEAAPEFTLSTNAKGITYVNIKR